MPEGRPGQGMEDTHGTAEASQVQDDGVHSQAVSVKYLYYPAFSQSFSFLNTRILCNSVRFEKSPEEEVRDKEDEKLAWKIVDDKVYGPKMALKHLKTFG